MQRLILSFLLLGTMAGCGTSAGPAETPSSGIPTVAQASDEDMTCSRDSQCVIVQDCCGCERQGRLMAVHRDRLPALRQASTAACASISCTVAHSTHRSCTAESAVCRGGRCIPSVN